MPISKPFRIITEGDTTDGRVVDRSWIEQMAASYDRAKYGARVWLEHIRGILPDSPFKAYGDVLKLGTEEVAIDGKKLLALTGVVDATPELVAMHKARQKIYCSAEVDPNFAKSGKAYLAGLAVTDTPASLGTEMMSFAGGLGDKNPLNPRKQNPANLFSAASEISIEWEPDESAQNGSFGESFGAALLGKVKALLGGKTAADETNFSAVGQAITAVAESQKTLLDNFGALQKTLADMGAALKAQTDAATADRQAFADLKKSLDENDPNPARPAASGGAGDKVTDC